MRIKSGVDLQGVSYLMWYAAAVWEYVLQLNGIGEGTITSGREGVHSRESAHYEGLALDFRTRDISPARLRALAGELQRALGPEYRVILESDHLHVQFGTQGIRVEA